MALTTDITKNNLQKLGAVWDIILHGCIAHLVGNCTPKWGLYAKVVGNANLPGIYPVYPNKIGPTKLPTTFFLAHHNVLGCRRYT
jgi:hypothetical protein